MLKKKLLILVSITCVISLTASFKQDRPERRKPPFPRFQQQKVRVLNEGLPSHPQRIRYVPDQILVKFNPRLSVQSIETTIAAYQTNTIKKIPKLDIYQLRIAENLTVEEMVNSMNQNPDIELAEPNYIAYIAASPNDTLFRLQYALHNTGQTIEVPGSPQAKASADIKATPAWDETKGDEDVIIAILDSGVDFSHPEILNKVISRGRDFVNDDYEATDDLWHGTHVAGIAAGETNNIEGIAGVAWNCKILPVKVIDVDGTGAYGWLIDAIRWAADNGADIINLSLGGPDPSIFLEDALNYAYQKDIFISAAAGSDAGPVVYPAAYDAYVMAVAATDYNDNRAQWSASGPEVDVAAPGEVIISCIPLWNTGPGFLPYAFASGTSTSSPHVAGLAALIRSLKPWLNVEEIMDIIRYSADDVNSVDNPGKDDFIGYGRINMEKALVPIKITGNK